MDAGNWTREPKTSGSGKIDLTQKYRSAILEGRDVFLGHNEKCPENWAYRAGITGLMSTKNRNWVILA